MTLYSQLNEIMSSDISVLYICGSFCLFPYESLNLTQTETEITIVKLQNDNKFHSIVSRTVCLSFRYIT